MRRMLHTGVLAAVLTAGCAHDDAPPPSPARVPGKDEVKQSDDAKYAKPLPDSARGDLLAPAR